jgi:peroxiredoxin
LPHLEDLHQRFREKGLVVLGFNCADDRAIAVDLLQKSGATFPVVLDRSDAASKVFFEGYQRQGMSAVPLHYLIDREGGVADAWYGPEPEREREALGRLGIE